MLFQRFKEVYLHKTLHNVYTCSVQNQQKSFLYLIVFAIISNIVWVMLLFDEYFWSSLGYVLIESLKQFFVLQAYWKRGQILFYYRTDCILSKSCLWCRHVCYIEGILANSSCVDSGYIVYLCFNYHQPVRLEYCATCNIKNVQ